MQDRPTINELLRGIARFLETEVVPALGEPQRFHTRVAANLLKILDRETGLGQALVREERDQLCALLNIPPDPAADASQELAHLKHVLCERIQAGWADDGPERTAVMDWVTRSLVNKLQIANPPMIEKAQRVDQS